MIGKNNPLNIRYNSLNRWIGLTGSTRGFCDFSDPEYCVRAIGVLLIRSYPKKGCRTIAQMIMRYAPPYENNTLKYIDYVADCMDRFPFDIPKDLTDYSNMITAMSYFEGNKLSYNYVESILKKYFDL